MGSGERGMEISLGAACCHWNRTCTEHNWWQCCFESGSTSCSTTTETELETELHSVLGKLDAMRSTLISQQNELNLILSRRRLFESSTRCPENSSVWEQPWHGRFIALQCLWYCFFYQLHVGIPQRMSLCRNVGFYFFWREIAWFISWLAYVSVSERNIVEQVNLIALFLCWHNTCANRSQIVLCGQKWMWARVQSFILLIKVDTDIRCNSILWLETKKKVMLQSFKTDERALVFATTTTLH